LFDCIGSMLCLSVVVLVESMQMILEFAAEGTYPSSVNEVIEDIFSNLLSNAIKYSPKESRIVG
jgi:two-component system, OmpR family, phosphate regulon sensor histidine kinase PhoR